MKTVLLQTDGIHPLCYGDTMAEPDGSSFDFRAVLTFGDDGEAVDFCREVGLDGFAPHTLADDTVDVLVIEEGVVGTLSIRPDLWPKVLVMEEAEPPSVWLGLHKPMRPLTAEEIEGSFR